MTALGIHFIRQQLIPFFRKINQYPFLQVIPRRTLGLDRMSMPKKDLEILYRSSNYVAVNKGCDVLINSNDPDEVPTVESQLSQLHPELRDPSVVHGFRFTHRLDYATSGVLCLSLNRKAARRLQNAFAKREVVKHYLALVRGHVNFEEMVIDQPLCKDLTVDFNKIRTYSTGEEVDSLSAQTRIIRLEHGSYSARPASKVLLIPYTGRTHQLRVHCLHIGHTVVGDFTYSNRSDVEPYRMMLHAYRLALNSDLEPLDISASDPFLPTTDSNWEPQTVYMTYSQFHRDETDSVSTDHSDSDAVLQNSTRQEISSVGPS